MKEQLTVYFRALYISLVIILCLCLGWIGISTAWENTVRIAFGEEKKAIELEDGKLRILDFEIDIK